MMHGCDPSAIRTYTHITPRLKCAVDHNAKPGVVIITPAWRWTEGMRGAGYPSDVIPPFPPALSLAMHLDNASCMPSTHYRRLFCSLPATSNETHLQRRIQNRLSMYLISASYDCLRGFIKAILCCGTLSVSHAQRSSLFLLSV